MKLFAILSLIVLTPITALPADPATKPTTAPAAEVSADGSIILKPEGARIIGFRMRVEMKPVPTLVRWVSSDEYPEWPQAVAKKGIYGVEVTYSCAPKAGGDFVVIAAANRVSGTTHETADWQTFTTQKLENLKVLNDNTTISLHCNGRLDHALMNVRSIKLTPVEEGKK
jgi:hypothetical protein